VHLVPGLRGGVPRRGGFPRPCRGWGSRAVNGDPVHPIEAESYAVLAGRVDLSAWPPGDRDVVARMVHATADESFARTARIGSSAVESAVEALKRGSPVICDANMVVAGLPRVPGAVCYLDRVPHAPAGSTRSAAAFVLAASEHPTGAVWVIGNAPTALACLVDLWSRRLAAPAAVVGLPVGYVGAAESKRLLWRSELRSISITNAGPRGGSPVAAAAVNALARLAAARPGG
jgi:precorrin-8X/cobalt-precorrin-8 methylmutase